MGTDTERLKARPAGQSCKNCRFFIDYSRTSPDEDEPVGYCGVAVAKYGLEKGCEMTHGYGGHWACSGDWCSQWEGGEKVWQPTEE